MTMPDFQEEATRKRVDHLSASARAELEKRYPDTNTSRAIDKALERLRTLEQVLKLSTNPTDKDPKKLPFDFTEIIAALAPRPFFANAPVHDDNF